MLLYLIRHAQSTNNDLYVRTGSSDGRHVDPPLTELGHRQARQLARFLTARPDNPAGDAPQSVKEIVRHDRHGFGLTHLYCSLMARAVQTGSYVAEATGLSLVGWTEVHERGGIYHFDEETGEKVGLPGPARSWFTTEFPHLILPEMVNDSGWWNRPHETLEEARDRASLVLTQLMARHGNTNDRVAIISHMGFFQCLLTAMLATESGEAIRNYGLSRIVFGMSNVSISRFDFDGALYVRYLNRIDFLTDELVTG